jgi:hypothetical protein
MSNRGKCNAGRVFVFNPESGLVRSLPPKEAQKLLEIGWLKGNGKGGRPLPAAQKAKISRSMKGRTYSAERRAAMSAAKKGKKFTPQHLKNMSLAKMGHEVSESTKQMKRECRWLHDGCHEVFPVKEKADELLATGNYQTGRIIRPFLGERTKC